MREIWDNAWTHIWDWIASSSKAHHTVLLITGATFAVAVIHLKADPMTIAAIGTVLTAIYGTNAWAGTQSRRNAVTPPAATPPTVTTTTEVEPK
jgi:hypothetical protein